MGYTLRLLSLNLIFTIIGLHNTTAYANPNFDKAYKAIEAGNYRLAHDLWLHLAVNGDPAAQYAIGWLYESGQGVEKNLQQAIQWYTKAAEQNHVAAQYILATMYDNGQGVDVNPSEAVKWYLKAAQQGDAIAQYQMGDHFKKGNGVKQNDDESFLWFSKAAAQGHLNAQISLGTIYQNGRVVQQDYQLAIEWYDKAATQGNALAQYLLAQMHEYGRGVPQNYQQAKTLYLKSSENNYAPSAYKIAEFYEQGKGEAVDLKNAITWYTRAAAKGSAAAQFKLGQIYQNATINKQNMNTALTWYNSAAAQNHAQSLYQLGVIYEHGIHDQSGKFILPKNKNKAAEYYLHASQLNYHLANARLAYFYEKGIVFPSDLHKAITLYQKTTEPWAIQRLKDLQKSQQCFKNATTFLFDIAIACSQRDTIREKIKATGIRPINENDQDFVDLYFTGATISGTSQLAVTYTQHAQFAQAKYTYIGRDKPQLIAQLKNEFTEKYGIPDSFSTEQDSDDINGIDYSHGKISFVWLLHDNIELLINREWPDTTTYVTYSYVEPTSPTE
ncbi:tetratricopeptide repeat protein [Psychromonas sp. MME2]|uniref:SEL1-like repeat protein n=1 Tax=unclassified Psychromonas TaxID=2614957 RepID=UPI00339BB46D